ncbi:SDR family oxidoreductase [Caulobacter sp.]|uniref:SDR family oxidoreductase n=1 Tax=Caulobacter sp. TaxID=78 RepID=UPI002B46A4AC|nr:SDR family oxidoreductase [Caulobacter sp.]HJV41555.1 SDR family oxidoreductase [Caulobacter sp.]
MIDLSGQRVLVIGGSSGIGLATAQLACEQGAAVTIASRSADKVSSAASSIGPSVIGQALDLTNDTAVETFFASAAAFDHVIVTGSQTSIAAVRDLPLETAYAAVNSKFWGFYRVARAAKISSGGSLSVVSGFLASRPAAGRALMGAINAGLEALVRGLALELKPIRVNAVSPAVVRTEMWAEMTPEARAAMYARMSATYPAGRVGEPRDIARQLLLLAATGYATGTIVMLDGGASIA